jgi:hypothetical protein
VSRLPVFFAFAVLAGCGESPTERTIANVKLEVLAGSYARSDTIKANLDNGLGTDVAYDADQCPGYSIERQSAGSWIVTDSTPHRACGVNAILFAVRAGESVLVIQRPIHDWMPNGTYRFRMTVQPNGGRAVEILSNSFDVRGS